jgi:hypothetical protein
MGALESKAALEQSATQDVGKLPEYNVYGRTPEQNERYAKFLEESEKKLADRYNQPNLWNVAAAFAKPQLGGFMASLGSAAEEVGRNEEQRRAQQLPMFKVRAEIEARKANLDNQQTASDLLNASLKTGQPVNENTLAQIIGLVGEQNPVAQAAYKNSDLFLRNEANKRGNISTSIEGQKAALDNPAIVINDPMFKGTLAENATPEQAKAYEAKLNAAKPQGIDQEEWNSMGVTAKSALVAESSRAKLEQNMNENQKSLTAAKSADTLLDDLSDLRTIAVDPKIAPVFSLFKNGDAFSMIRAYLDKNPGNANAAVEGMVNAAMQNIQNPDKDTRAKVDKLVKGIARLEYNMRGSSVNPTNALQELTRTSSPNLLNSQAGFVGILDQLGLQADRDIALHNFRVKSKVGENEMFSSAEARKLRQQYRDAASDLASRNSLETKPSWYSATSGSSIGANAAAASRASNAPAAPAAASTQPRAAAPARTPAEVIAEIRAAQAANAPR